MLGSQVPTIYLQMFRIGLDKNREGLQLTGEGLYVHSPEDYFYETNLVLVELLTSCCYVFEAMSFAIPLLE